MAEGVGEQALRNLPRSFIDRARDVASGAVQPATPRHAATVVLLRDGDDGVEAYLLRRLAALEFAGGMYVFPGGSVDQRDADTAIGWVGPQPDEWAPALDADLPLARALVCAAVRETFEESGVLLAGADDTDVVALASNVEHWAGEQAALLDRSASMADVLARNGLVLRTDLLRPWAHWTTPEIEPKRFDTRFFVAALPAHQEPLAHTAEAEHGGWRRPAEALQAHAAGELGMLPPTAFTLAELAEYGTVDEVLAAATSRDIRRVLPKIVVTGDEVSFLLPGDAGYPGG